MNALPNDSIVLSAPSTSTASLTIADAQQRLATWSDLAPARVRKLRTALTVAARLLAPGDSPATAARAVSLDCPTLSRLLKGPAATFGLSRGRRASLCSELRYILRRLGLHDADSRGAPLTSATLQSCLTAMPRLRQLALVDFLRFLEGENILPEAVGMATVEAYQARCTARTLCRDPVARIRLIASAWNWACQNVPGWPGQRLIRTGRADHYTLPLNRYPASFARDVERYMDRLRGDDIDHIFAESLFDAENRRPHRAPRLLRTSSVDLRRWIIRCAAAALVLKGVDPSELVSLRDLVQPLARPEAILRFYLERRDGRANPMAARVAQMLYLLARDYCDLPDEQATIIAGWAKRVRPPEPTGLTDKNTRRLRALMQPRVRAMLLCYPMELMRQATLPSTSPRQAARLAMYATAMEILLICPMRRGNLAALRLDRHLHQPDPRKPHVTHIIIDADEVKNAQPIHWPIPKESQKLIETYMTRYRHQLVEPGNPFLFGADGQQRSAIALGGWLSRSVTRDIGVEFNVHLARHFAAWNFLRLNPGQYEVVRQVLGHRNLKVTMAHYVGLEAASAAQHFDAVVLRERQAIRQVAAQAFRKGTGGLRSSRQGKRS